MEGKFAHWSVENATKAYLNTLRMGMKRGKEPDESEFISAIAAGSNAELIVVACGGSAAPSTVLALVAAAQQTRGRVVCIYGSLEDLESSKESTGLDVGDDDIVDFVVGDAQRLILEDYKEADFVVLDCKLKEHQMILREMQSGGKCKESVVVLGYDAFSNGSWQWVGFGTQLLPIGDGLLFTQIGASHQKSGRSSLPRKSHWVVKVDKHTGEEHVFRVR